MKCNYLTFIGHTFIRCDPLSGKSTIGGITTKLFPIDKVCICMYNTITQFEWDHYKAQKNWHKHRITFEQAK